MLCVLIVEGMSVVVNVMLSLMRVMSPPPALCNLSELHPSFSDSGHWTSWSGGRIMAQQSSDRGIESQGNPIILPDLTQECRNNL